VLFTRLSERLAWDRSFNTKHRDLYGTLGTRSFTEAGRSWRKWKTPNVPQWSQHSFTVPSGSLSSTCAPRESRVYLTSRYPAIPEHFLHLPAQYNLSVIPTPTTINPRGGPVDEKVGLAEWCGVNGNATGTGERPRQPHQPLGEAYSELQWRTSAEARDWAATPGLMFENMLIFV
jgi:hypothetical protein